MDANDWTLAGLLFYTAAAWAFANAAGSAWLIGAVAVGVTATLTMQWWAPFYYLLMCFLFTLPGRDDNELY